MIHFTDEGRIDIDNKRQDKSKRDAYRVGGKSLVSKGKEIQNITDCDVFIDVVPTWKNGKMWIYKSPGYQQTFERGDDTSLTTSLDSSVITASNPPSSSSPAIHETPKKSIQNPNESSSSSSGLDPETCQIC